jgi:hypothetical protein
LAVVVQVVLLVETMAQKVLTQYLIPLHLLAVDTVVKVEIRLVALAVQVAVVVIRTEAHLLEAQETRLQLLHHKAIMVAQAEWVLLTAQEVAEVLAL